MSKFVFIKNKDSNNEFDTSTVKMESDTEVLGDILEDFENFLRGCGYIINGTIDVVPNENEGEDT